MLPIDASGQTVRPKSAVWEVYKFIHVNTVAPFGTFRTKNQKVEEAHAVKVFSLYRGYIYSATRPVKNTVKELFP